MRPTGVLSVEEKPWLVETCRTVVTWGLGTVELKPASDVRIGFSFLEVAKLLSYLTPAGYQTRRR